jgi:rhamnosyltransferase subunit B
MKILLAALGSYGDIYPQVGLALELKRRGHSVTLFSNPFFEKLAGKYGLDFVPIGDLDQYERFANHPALFDARKSVPVFFNTLLLPNLRSAYDRLLEHIEPDHTVIVSSITVFAARLVQEKHNIPNVTVHLAPLAFKSAYEMPRNAIFSFPNGIPIFLKRFYWWVADKALIDRMLCPELNSFRRELGLPPASRIMTRWGHSPQRVIGMFPSWYATPQPDWPPETCLTGFPLFDEDEEADLAPEVWNFLEAGEPPVLFMPGSLMQQAGPFFKTAVQACQQLGKRAILLSRYRHQIPEGLPHGIRHFEYIPFRKILPCASALVHHGGIGTCAQALRAGVPQLIHPMAYDQYDNAWRLKKIEVGDQIIPKDWHTPAVTEKLDNLTSSRNVRQQCRLYASKIKGTESLEETCELIEAVL